MKKKSKIQKLSNKDIANKIDNEGLDYYILHYVNVDEIKDDELRESFILAKHYLEKITNILAGEELEE